MAQIPRGRVMTYGQIAALCGNARAARIVGGIAHFGGAYLHTTPDCPYAKRTAPPELAAHSGVVISGTHSPSQMDGSLRFSTTPWTAFTCSGCAGPELPWQRVVNKRGGMAAGYPGGRKAHQAALEGEGLQFNDRGEVAAQEVLWWPE